MVAHRAKRPPPLERSKTVPESQNYDNPFLESPRSRSRRRWRIPNSVETASPHGFNSTSEKVPDSEGSNAGGADPPVAHEQGNWDQVAADFEVHDEKLVRKWNEQIDSLLVFAGLFSAVITSFNVESYKNLQLDATEASQILLVTISQQLSDLPRAFQSANASNATAAALAQLAAFEPLQTDVWVNGLWFASLVCSLIAASLAILVKQWLQRYKLEDYSPARERTRIREHRFGGLLKWCVPEIVAFLPLLLRTSLNLFFIGLVVFLRGLHRPIAAGITALIALWFGAYIFSLVLPSIFDTCPYKSPEATFFYILRRIKDDGLRKTLKHWAFISWSDGEEAVKRNTDKDVETLATVDRTFADRGLEMVVRGCLKDLNGNQVIECIILIISRRLHTYVSEIAEWASLDTSRITKRCAESLINVLVDTVERLLTNVSSFVTVMDDRVADWVQDAMHCTTYLLRCVEWGTEETSFDERLTKVMLTVLEILARGGISADDPLARQLMSIFCTRPALLHKSFVPMVPQLFYMAISMLSSPRYLKETTTVKICTAMLSLASLVEPDSFDAFGVGEFLEMVKTKFDYCTLPPGSSSAARLDLIRDVTLSREKAVEIDAKKPGIANELLRALDDLLADVVPRGAETKTKQVRSKDKSV